MSDQVWNTINQNAEGVLERTRGRLEYENNFMYSEAYRSYCKGYDVWPIIWIELSNSGRGLKNRDLDGVG